ncbi:MAG TPA: glucose-1-phosphate adenylyltransferase [Planctomycetaceae bacterium]|nr:glucose-1-phosphate adenylyltransferase [Planctomycetaceae bacterium]
MTDTLDMRRVVSVILGGGKGTRLFPLTQFRSKPAVPLAGKYRLIDIPISNCLNSQINRIYLVTQFNSVSLHRHIRQTYSFDHFNGGFVEVLAAQQTMEATDWYQGTADAVRKNLRYLEQHGIDYVAILSGDQLYRMDYRKMLRTHIESKAEVTIAGLPVDRQAAKGFGIMQIDDSGRVLGFCEKPQTDAEIDTVRMPPEWIDARGIESRGRDCIASMGIYLFNRDKLVDLLRSYDHEDFGREVFPACINDTHVQVHLFDGYWEDIGTIKSFFHANLDLAGENPPFEFIIQRSPIYSRARYLPPTHLSDATVKRSLIADGCLIGRGAVIENSVVGLRCRIGENVTIRNSILMGADYYESPGEVERMFARGEIPIGIGAGSQIEGAIVDKNSRIGKNVKLIPNGQSLPDSDRESVHLRDGIIVTERGAVLADGWCL